MISGSINEIVDASWLARPSPNVAPELIGCTLVRQLPNGEQIRGMIVETEAYETGDPACHAYRRRTPRNGVMFGPAGISYVYLIYGIYHCLNILTSSPPWKDGDSYQSNNVNCTYFRRVDVSQDAAPFTEV
jgi:DNA-3-methyladenine glycosylase